jgi:phage regulator Rha-like protein
MKSVQTFLYVIFKNDELMTDHEKIIEEVEMEHDEVDQVDDQTDEDLNEILIEILIETELTMLMTRAHELHDEEVDVLRYQMQKIEKEMDDYK